MVPHSEWVHTSLDCDSWAFWLKMSHINICSQDITYFVKNDNFKNDPQSHINAIYLPTRFSAVLGQRLPYEIPSWIHFQTYNSRGADWLQISATLVRLHSENLQVKAHAKIGYLHLLSPPFCVRVDGCIVATCIFQDPLNTRHNIKLRVQLYVSNTLHSSCNPATNSSIRFRHEDLY